MNARANGHEARAEGAEQVKIFRPLARTSQTGADTSVMYFDASVPGSEIYEQAQYRISLAQSMLESYAASDFNYEDERMGQNLASVAALVISDAMALVDEMGRRGWHQDGPTVGEKGDVVVSITSASAVNRSRNV